VALGEELKLAAGTVKSWLRKWTKGAVAVPAPAKVEAKATKKKVAVDKAATPGVFERGQSVLVGKKVGVITEAGPQVSGVRFAGGRFQYFNNAIMEHVK
jgi:hypothetical protein